MSDKVNGNAGFNVALQKQQQRLGTLERNIAAITQMVSELRDRNQTPPETPDDGSADEVVDRGTLTAALKQVQKELDESLAARLTETLQPVLEVTSESKAKSFRDKWNAQHPAVADKFDDLLAEAESLVDTNYDFAGDERARNVAINSAFDVIVQNAEKTSNPGGKTSGKANPKPPTSTEGTEITPEGSSTGAAPTEESVDIGPLWVDDENE